MPTLDQIRAAIKTRIESVPAVGVVHDYERFAAEQAKFREFYLYGVVPNQRVTGWHIRRAATREIYIDVNRWVIYHDWRIRGFMSINDADGTEKIFDNLIEAVRDAFRASPMLTAEPDHSEVVTDEERAGVQVPDSGPVMFSGVLCHGARLELTSRHYL